MWYKCFSSIATARGIFPNTFHCHSFPRHSACDLKFLMEGSRLMETKEAELFPWNYEIKLFRAATIWEKKKILHVKHLNDLKYINMILMVILLYIITMLLHMWLQFICLTPTLTWLQVCNKYPSALVRSLRIDYWHVRCALLTFTMYRMISREPSPFAQVKRIEVRDLLSWSFPTLIDVNASLSGSAVIKNSDSDFDFPSIKSRRHSSSLPWAGQAFGCD